MKLRKEKAKVREEREIRERWERSEVCLHTLGTREHTPELFRRYRLIEMTYEISLAGEIRLNKRFPRPVRVEREVKERWERSQVCLHTLGTREHTLELFRRYRLIEMMYEISQLG
jgi:hypothetical protein